MPREARLDAPGTLHHVMGRGIERTDIFRTDEDRNDFLNRTKRGTFVQSVLDIGKGRE